ncbi:MAG TPA: extracellular solute-binding protein, partial [Tepiditoga sp.]|nr:extracellular solute-binding protein [Tepiditoga sp.]
ENIPEPLRVAATFENGVYAIPTGMYFMGYFANDDLFDKYNITKLPFSPVWQRFMASVRALSNPSEKILGLGEEVQIPEWYPASVNSNLGWYTWDGEKYNLDGKEFITSIKLAKQIFTSKYVFDSLSEQEKKLFNAGWYGEAWDQGEIALRWSGTWDINSFKNLKFNSRFIGVPGGRTPVVGDFMVISSSTKNAEAAYKFIRYITFAREGILKRLEIDKDNEWASLPLTTEKAILNRYFAEKPAFPGIKEAFDSVDNGIIEGVKIVPGYNDSRWTAPTGLKIGENSNSNIGDVIWNSMRGNINIADYASDLNELANKSYQNGFEVIDSLLK